MTLKLKPHKVIVLVFFALFLIIGLLLVKDYGISWDENQQRNVGYTTFDYIFQGNQSLLQFDDRAYGPIFEVFLVALEKGLHLTDNDRALFLMRHIVTFLLFYLGIIFFYKLCKKIFNSWQMGLWGSLFLIISPRIFADAFYNSKDIPCLSLFIIGTYTLINYLENKAFVNAIVHALVSAILIDIRIVGILIPFLTLLFILADIYMMRGIIVKSRFFGINSIKHTKLDPINKNSIWENVSSATVRLKPDAELNKEAIQKIAKGDFDKIWTIIQQAQYSTGLNLKRYFLSFVAYCFFLIVLTILFWPFLWSSPLSNFKYSLSVMAHYNFPFSVLYFGQYYVKPAHLPWHYIPVWIAISTPLAYSIAFCVGYSNTVMSAGKNFVQFYQDHKSDLIILLLFSLPILAVILLKSVVYNAWRQMYFVYPAFLVLSLIGLRALFDFVRGKRSSSLMQTIIISLIVFNLSGVVLFMVRNHPYQNLYFNSLAGRDMKEVKARFDLDYWSLSLTNALEYIVTHDPDPSIKIYVGLPFVHGYPLGVNTGMLKDNDKKRLVFIDHYKGAKYFLGDYWWHKEEYPFKNEFYSIKVNEEPVAIVYRLEG